MMREYIEIICISIEDVVEEISLKLKADCEFVSVIAKGPSTFLLRMMRE
jgi:hypothetical protein